jgi:nucleotide-binding universal stress UspA family protein
MEKIIVAVDGGTASSSAIAWVADRARSTQLQVQILTVALGVDGLAPGIVDSALERLRSSAPGLSISTQIRHGAPDHELILSSHHADLLVVGARPTGGLTAAFSATLPFRVAGHSVCVTVVVPEGWEPTADSIVVGWSDDPTSDSALNFAADEAERLDRTLVIVHTWSIPSPVADASADELAVDDLAHSHQELLARAVARVRSAHSDLRVASTIEIGAPAPALLRAAARSALVVVGSRGRGPITSLLLGSVSHELLSALPAPVAVWPSPTRGVDVYPDVIDGDDL